ncbi:hypothetical protein ACVWXS_003156 [Lysinibacillus sp. TE18511]
MPKERYPIVGFREKLTIIYSAVMHSAITLSC